MTSRAMITIAPSLPARSFQDLEQLFESLRGVAEGIQVDIVDGMFAPYVSWPFLTSDVEEELQKLAPYSGDFEIEMDCMCMYPERYLDRFVALGARRVVIHAESTQDYEACIRHAHSHGYRIGFGILNTTSQELQDAYIPLFDYVQVMGIEHIGVQGQPFDERTIGTIQRLRAAYPTLEIAVDGAVNESTIPRLLTAGADRLAPGSAIAQAPDPKGAFESIRTLALGL